jgi:hypothetical protein
MRHSPFEIAPYNLRPVKPPWRDVRCSVATGRKAASLGWAAIDANDAMRTSTKAFQRPLQSRYDDALSLGRT